MEAMSNSEPKRYLIDFNLEQFEGWVYTRDYKQATRSVMCILEHLGSRVTLGMATTGGEQLDNAGKVSKVIRNGLPPFTHPNLTFKERRELYNRLASALTALLVDREFRVSKACLAIWLMQKNYISDVFELSSFGNMDHVLVMGGLLTKDGQFNLGDDEYSISRLLMCYSLVSSFDFDLNIIFDHHPDYATLTYIGLLYSSHRKESAVADARINALVSDTGLMNRCVPIDYAVTTISNPWMLTSYLDLDDRHECKAAMNEFICRWLKANKIRFKRKPQSRKKKTLLVLPEVLSPGHAMYRCYIRRISALRKEYRTVLVSQRKNMHEEVRQHFDASYQLTATSGSPEEIREALEQVKKYSPDIIYYPSLGMAWWTVVLCNMRLAPVQAMTPGHPATSRSKCMDYILVNNMGVSEEELQPYFTERVIQTDLAEGVAFEPHKQMPEVLPVQTVNDGVVRVAVNSHLQKVSHRFLKLCMVVQQMCTVPVQFQFFVGDQSTHHEAFAKCVGEMLPGSVTHAGKRYDQYLQDLAQCDIAFGTFPFGGTNTNVDLAILGIPKIMMRDTTDFAGLSDKKVWNRLGVPDIVYAENEAKYMATAIALIHDEPRREALRQAILDLEPRKILFAHREDSDEMLLNAFARIEKLEAAGGKKKRIAEPAGN